ncbi:MAG TPA: glutathione S-transferase family protein [Dongiaceae bacterium]|nr:glutathione S-transferase family protein [Dongiaceae bacterium]
MQQPELILISHHLCPYVQRSVIVLTEKCIPYERRYIDLSDKPEWFIELSPTGKVPLLWVDRQAALFESAVICEYLNEITPGNLHSDDPLQKAQDRAWIEYGSQILNDIARLYNAREEADFLDQCKQMARKWRRLELEVQEPYFNGPSFGMVDAAYGPIFRYFDVMEACLPVDLFAGCDGVRSWRHQLSQRSSVQQAVEPVYNERLRLFLLNRNSHISTLLLAELQQPALRTG